MALVVRVGSAKDDLWRGLLQRALPELPCYGWDDAVDPERVHYAVVWQPPPGGLRRFPNLRAIFSIGAGVDHIFCDPELPAVPVIRLADAELSQRMAEYVVLQTLRCLRRQADLDRQQRAGHWEPLLTPPAGEWTVGVMGLGEMGRAAARALAGIGFRVRGWARNPRELEGLTTFAGVDELPVFLAECRVLVCLLPLTAQTEGILNRSLFERLPTDAWVINAGRGEHLVEADLLNALDQELLAGAVLDVFRTEPLPAEHPFWTHPGITVTPHVASRIDPPTGCRLLAVNIRRFMAGDPLEGLRVDPGRGY